MESNYPITAWLPMSLEEAGKRGWESFDIILITGDAYVDHPSFGVSVIGRILESQGYRVGIIAQPNWRDDLRDFRKLGVPNLFFGVTSGNMDSMVNHYTASRRLRSDDAYTPGGVSGFRPDYASTVYTKILKTLFPGTPVVIGGIEASLRRITHYDFWSDTVKPSILHDSGADLLIYGMGEEAIIAVAGHFAEDHSFSSFQKLRQVAFMANEPEVNQIKKSPYIELPSHDICLTDKGAFGEAFRLVEAESNKTKASTILQQTGNQWLVITPPYPLTGSGQLDSYYALPYTRLPHPRYRKRGAIPAHQMIRHSVTIHRGCFGGCSFCTISMHQGKMVASRSGNSIVQEVEQIVALDDFKGIITDLGGPSANMYQMGGIDKSRCSRCSRPSCIWPSVCQNLNFNHEPLINLYRTVGKVKGVRKIFIGSGIRYDMLVGHTHAIADKYRLKAYTTELVKHHVSGRLKVAPEHSDPGVLKLIRKPSFEAYLTFRADFYRINKEAGLNQQLIPYLISSLPGCDMKAMGVLAADLAQTGYRPEQVQDFTPTPMTLSNVMYYTGMHPETKKPVYVPGSDQLRRKQHLFLFWYKPENRKQIISLLKEQGQHDLIGKIYRDFRK
jgi:uncharacterized radical SAM protein YgiQ